jgi:hypothetical protein
MVKACVSAAVLCLAAGWAMGQGPDVIVGDLPSVDNSLGTVNGRRLYAVGTTSCNLGSEPLAWVSNTNQHPVISQNIYRLMNGRFEQMGQAWLKHGFCALQGNVCASCTPGGNCSALFPGCSDPYSASLNGTPGGLGPKSEVNPVTGYFPYPWISNGTGGLNSVQKLMGVAVSELEAGLANNALWFLSSMYIQPEDAAAGNDLNNQSYRRGVVAPGTYNITMVDNTQRTKPAIYAWRDHGLGANSPDPNVVISVVDVPGDGRFIVAAKATNTGGTNWHYEYAIQNYNSDRAAQAFRVPVPAGTTVVSGSIGFHDVEYTNGEPYSGADWTGVAAGDAVTWATQTYAANVNANALRWDTIYNFWFDCNQPPSGGAATITLFKPGTPTSVSVGTIIPSPDGVFHPLNDNCAEATDVGAGTTSFSNANAATDGPEEPDSCNVAGYNQAGADVWFRYTSGSCVSGPTTVSTCGSGFDTKIFVYEGTCPTAPGAAIACSDDSNTCGTGSLQSSLTFQHQPNTTYLIRVGGYNGATGSGTLTITPPTCGPVAPSNDDCSGAIFLADGVTVTGSTALATNDGTATCGSSTTTRDVWYAYRPLTSGTVNVNTCGSSYDTAIAVFTGSCGSLTQIGCNDDNAGSGGNNACGGGLSSGMNVSMTAGTTYYIRVAGYNGAAGNFNIRVIGGDGVVPAANDSCSSRPGVGLGETPFSNINCTTDGPAHALCNANGSGTITGDLWYNFPSTLTGTVRIDTCSDATDFNTRIAVYSGSGCDNLESRLVACNDDSDCGAGRSSVLVPVVAGQHYTIRLGGHNGATGSGVMTITDVTAPSCGPADFDGDGDIGTDADIEAFFACLAGNCCPTCFEGGADFNGDGDVGTDADIESFFRVLAGGGC